MVLVWPSPAPLSPARPIRLISPPGVELLRRGLPRLDVVVSASPAALERIARSGIRTAFSLFDLETLPAAVAAARQLGTRCATVAVRGRVVPAEALDAFEELWLGRRFLDRLVEAGIEPPSRWRTPTVEAELWRRGGSAERVAVVFSACPEPGLLDLADVGRDGRRDGAVASALEPAPSPPWGEGWGEGETCAKSRRTSPSPGLRRLVGLRPPATQPPVGRHPDVHCTSGSSLQEGEVRNVLLVDNGGDFAAIADRLAAEGRLAGTFTSGSSRAPRLVSRSTATPFIWLEPDDDVADVEVTPDAIVFVPIGLAGETPAVAARRIALVRSRGAAAVVPRFDLPVPSTREWQERLGADGLAAPVPSVLDGQRPLFAAPGWDEATARSFVAACHAANRWPEGAAGPRAISAYSLPALRTVLEGYVGEARAGADAGTPLRDLLVAIVPDGALEPLAVYPFVAWRGESLLAIVERAIAERLATSGADDEALASALRQSALAGGKRIRPVLALALALAHGAPADAALAAALALEWIHTASLVQDDLPSMDDDPLRRGRASAHVRHGEGLALLASDALVALAFEDLAELGRDPRVGGERASRLVAAFARELGTRGLAGGQARDLVAAENGRRDLRCELEIHRRKTAPLFRLAATIAAVLADLPDGARSELEDALAGLGVAFQLVDDLLDEGRGESGARRVRRARLAARHAAPAAGLALAEPFRGALGRLADFVVARSA